LKLWTWFAMQTCLSFCLSGFCCPGYLAKRRNALGGFYTSVYL
jgi:hypothetical protein